MQAAILVPFFAVWVLLSSLVDAAIVTFGACHDPIENDGYRCAIHANNCEPGEQFVTPWAMSQMEDVKTCTCASTRIGRCDGGGSGVSSCAVEQSVCLADGQDSFAESSRKDNSNDNNPNVLEPHEDDYSKCMCTGLQVHKFSKETEHFQPTLYGACVDELRTQYYCVMQSHMCATNELWLSPMQLKKTFGNRHECNCKDVRVGACTQTVGSNCVIDADSCPENSTFVKPGEAFQQGIMCTLCGTSDLHTAHILHNEGKTASVRLKRLREKNQSLYHEKKGAVLTFVILGATMAVLNVYLAIKLRSVSRNSFKANSSVNTDDSTQTDSERGSQGAGVFS